MGLPAPPAVTRLPQLGIVAAEGGHVTSPANSSPPASRESQTLQALLSDLSCRWSGEKPLGQVFGTTTNRYYYDSATNKIFQCEPAEAEFLSLLQSKGPNATLAEFPARVGRSTALAVLSQVRALMDSENILSLTRARGFGLSPHHADYRSRIETSCEVLVLDTTEACNLRCRYCVYNPGVAAFRTHGTTHMPWDVARRAIDYLEAHSSALRKVSITFYGGEPLLNVDTITRSVEYALGKIHGRQLDFGISTNGTLITADIAHFLKSNDFRIALSLDGPQETHDMYRVDPKRGGSYDRVRRGLELLLAEYGDEAARRKISLNMVYMPPFTRQRLDSLRRWKESDPALGHLRVHVTYPVRGSQPYERHRNEIVKGTQNAYSWSEEDFRSSWGRGEEASSIAAAWIADQYESMNRRPVFSQPPFQFHLNGCCLPGASRLFVSVDGTFHVCEKIGRDAPPIGSVFDGIDIEAIKRVYTDDYERVSLPECSTCWAIRLCSMCYVPAMHQGRFDANVKAVYCSGQRNQAAWLLRSFCSLLEMKPDGFAKSDRRGDRSA